MASWVSSVLATMFSRFLIRLESKLVSKPAKSPNIFTLSTPLLKWHAVKCLSSKIKELSGAAYVGISNE